jgi:hypothetical protein
MLNALLCACFFLNFNELRLSKSFYSKLTFSSCTCILWRATTFRAQGNGDICIHNYIRADNGIPAPWLPLPFNFVGFLRLFRQQWKTGDTQFLSGTFLNHILVFVYLIEHC